MRLKICLLLALFLFPCAGSAQDMKAYRLQIGAATVEINPGETVDVTLPDGTTAKATLTRNDFTSYSAAAFSFVHPSEATISKSDLGDGIIQHLMATAVGTIVIVQEYPSLDPTTLNQLMLQEMTKESVAAGGKVTQQPATRQTPAGKTLNGLTAVETAGNDVADYEIFGYGAGGSGVLVVTRMDRSNAATDAAMIAKFWEGFEVR